ncbi:MAG TPA: EamA family transporter, partial [Salinisphaeraceae bacterium]|nr:EamA family transporter [Salinisphaeraceae bacterium]
AVAVIIGTELTILRNYPGIDRITIICASGLVAALVAWPLAQPLSLALPSYAALAIMGLLQMPAAMVLVAIATRYLPSPEVALFMLIESVLGPLWVWLVVGEVPPQLTFVGGALVLLTVALHAGLGVRESRRLTARRELLGKEA